MMNHNLREMMKSVYFRRIATTAFLFFLGVGCVLVAGITYHIRSSILDDEIISIQEKLVLLTPQAREVFASENYSGSQELFPHKSMLSQTRYTLIVPRGEVVGDSHVVPETIVNGWSFLEVQQSLTEDWGMAIRKVNGQRVLIVALALREDQRVIGVIRGEVSLATLDDLMLDAQRALVIMALLATGLAFVLGLVLTRSHTAPVAQMAEVCRAIQSGDYSQKVSQIPPDEMGQLAHTINDLSENVLNKISSLSLERAQLKSMLACMKEGILSLSDEGKIHFCNLAAYHHLDLSPEGDLRGMKITDIEGLDPVVKIWKEAAHHKELVVEEMSYRRTQNASVDLKYLKVYATFYESIMENKRIKGEAGVMIVIDNHTEIKQLQNMRKEFFAHVSHELKTPLTSIAGYVETLNGEEGLPPEDITKRFLAKISSNTERLLSLVMDLLSLTGLEAKDSPVQMRPVQWLPIIRSVAESYGLQIEKKNIRLEVLKQYGGLLVHGEKEAMHTICENLLSNAIRYSKKDSKICICFSKTRQYLYIHIVDSGVGISKEHLPLIFDRFYRVDKARSRAEGGTGLGLSIVKLFTERIGGTVSVESEVGKGSVFTVGLRRAF